MKWAIGLIVFVWLLCGLIGAWRLDDLHPQYWKAIAKGPFTLMRSFDEYPIDVPGPS